MKLNLHLDAQLKKTVEDLFFVSAQAPALGLESQKLTVDGHAIFRIAKEFSLTQPFEEKHLIDVEDIVRMLRFIIWQLSYGGELLEAGSSERQLGLRRLFTSVMLQAQAQYPGFESILKSYGLDRQLNPQSAEVTRQSARVALTRHDRKHEVNVSVDHRGANLTSVTTETTWTADGYKQTRR